MTAAAASIGHVAGEEPDRGWQSGPDGLRTLGRRRLWDREELAADVVAVAPTLLGALLVRGHGASSVIVRVVEVEAYRQDDPASHSYRGHTPATAPMFGAPGTAYVYFTYGMHHCVNVTCEPAGRGAAVLLRAAIVLEGIEAVRARRPGAADRDLLRGPARLTRGLDVDRSLSGSDLLDPRALLRLEADGWRPAQDRIIGGPRTGVRAAAARPWRFHLHDVPEVSPYRPHPAAVADSGSVDP